MYTVYLFFVVRKELPAKKSKSLPVIPNNEACLGFDQGMTGMATGRGNKNR